MLAQNQKIFESSLAISQIIKITEVKSSRLTFAYPLRLTTAGFISMAWMNKSICLQIEIIIIKKPY